MSTLVASTVKTETLTGQSVAGSIAVTGESGSTTTNLQQGLCKQWVLLQSSGTSVTDSFNNTGVTDNGTGDYTLTRTNNMANATYCAIGSSGDPQTSHNASSDVGEQTTSVHDIRCVNDAANATQDVPDTVGAVHGDLA